MSGYKPDTTITYIPKDYETRQKYFPNNHSKSNPEWRTAYRLSKNDRIFGKQNEEKLKKWLKIGDLNQNE